MTIDEIINKINNDLEGSFDLLLGWNFGNDRGKFVDLRDDFIALPIGSSKNGIREKLRPLVKKHFEVNSSKNLNEDEYLQIVEAIKINKGLGTTEILKGKKHSDLDQKELERFFDRPRVIKYLVEDGHTPESLSFDEKLEALNLSEAKNLLKGTFFSLGIRKQINSICLTASESKFIVFNGTTSDDHSFELIEVRGNLIQQFEEMIQLFRLHVKLAPRDINLGQDEFEIPFIVYREFVANAFIHRDYSSNNHITIQIELFDDRIEIKSPGLFPETTDKNNIQISNPVNPTIAAIFLMYGHVEKAGTGIKRAQSELKKFGLEPASIDPDEYQKIVKVTIHKKKTNPKQNTNPSVFPKFLTPPPYIPELFLGREAELDFIYHKLFHEENLLLLINGQGGIGKTTLAAKYLEHYQSHYSHLAWVFAGEDLTQALLTLAPKLNLSFPETMPNPERLHLLIQELSALDKPCLLIIDNANDRAELEKNYLALRSCNNFHILITSRLTEFEQVASFAIQTLETEAAIELFQRHYPKYNLSEQPLLQQILNAVGYNTLVIELLAKNLRNLNKLRQQYTLEDLLADLQHQGVFGISKSTNVNILYQAKGPALRQASPEEIISAMYELGELTNEESQLLSVFAVLPAERIELALLEKLLPDTPLDEPLTHLVQLGWLDFLEQDSSFKISPVVQQIVREKNKESLKADCQDLIDALDENLEWEGYGHYANYQIAAKLAGYATAVIDCIKEPDEDIANLCGKVGMYHRITGNLNAALFYFERYRDFEKDLLAINPKNLDFERNLAISYSNLGEIHRDLGNLEQTLAYFELDSELSIELYEAYSDDVTFKERLVISYSNLGEIHRDLGNLEKALTYFEKSNAFIKDLYISFPQIVAFKNGLAISYSNLGEIHRYLGDLEKALTYFEESNALGKELHISFPQNVGFQNGLAISYSNLGEVHRYLGNLEQALTYFEESNALGKDLYVSFPQNVGFKNGLAISYSNLGEIHRYLGNLEQALAYFEESNALGKELHISFPQNVGFKNGLAISHSNLGEIHRDLGDLEQALAYFEQSNALGNELFEISPHSIAFKNGLAASYSNLGKIHSDLNNHQKALQSFEQANQLFEALNASYPENLPFKNELTLSYLNLGDIHSMLNNLDEALIFFEKFNHLEKELNASYPEKMEFKNGLAISYQRLGWFYETQYKDIQKAKEQYQFSQVLFKELVTSFPDYAMFHERLEWVENGLSNVSG